ncbi:MAG: Asp-tRNA(Asn)/Glu-tRNA(Gln) amidotransferase subunit GatB [Phycisphaerae bacterium]
MSDIAYKVIIGLEIHIQLATESKMFCSCPNHFGDPPNSNVCPVCMGSPGVLPVMNKKAYEYAVRTALALNCQIAKFTKWDRKSYYYPDLPKNYQISQYDLPLSYDGLLEISVNGEHKQIRIRRVHLEEDAGKLLHEGNVGFSQVDLNRTGAPLMEIVTEPDLSSAEEARVFGAELRALVRTLGVSEANMQEGHMRLEPNINLAIQKDGKEYRTPITEVKNLGSLRALERAISYEINRQIADWQQTGITLETGTKSTRGWDDNQGVTVLQREKEEAHDYRYFPDPDLVPVVVEQLWVDEIKKNLPELPMIRRVRFRKDFGFNEKDAATLVEDRETADLFENALTLGTPVKTLCNHFIGFWSMHANQRNITIAQLGISAQRIAMLAKMVGEGKINPTAAAVIAEKMLVCTDDPQVIAEREKLIQVSDVSALETIIDEVLAANPKAMEDARTPGKKQQKSVGFLLGQVMQKSRGQANPQVVSEILGRKIGN